MPSSISLVGDDGPCFDDVHVLRSAIDKIAYPVLTKKNKFPDDDFFGTESTIFTSS